MEKKKTFCKTCFEIIIIKYKKKLGKQGKMKVNEGFQKWLCSSRCGLE